MQFDHRRGLAIWPQNRVNRFTVDTLINMLAHAGVRVSLTYQADPNDAGRWQSIKGAD
jgi:hypothetical protein